ncbi:MAG: RloB domain-containing protein [Acidimicrobiia bacterium]|nr:RloB domain-containing protein [Acidimicrobiia bacterium]MYJ13669.1 RloB domain-containing protein [Acidimicrobiia bacterium]
MSRHLLKKPRKTGRPRSGVELRRLVVFTEGSKTEVGYLNHWARLNRDRVTVAIDSVHGPPRKLVERAIRVRRDDLRESRRRDGDSKEYWCIFDRDEHSKLDEALEMARDNEISAVLSTPCIELWFVLHFRNQRAHLETKQAKSASRKPLRCAEALSSEALRELHDRFGDARRRARQLDGWHEANGSPPRSNPSSDVWRLIDRINEQ